MAGSKVKLAVGLDVGSARTRCAVCVVEDGKIRFLGSGEAEGRGWAKGRIADRAQLSDSVKAAAREAERQAQIGFDAAVVGLGGDAIKGANARGVYELGRPRQIDESDMRYAVELACRVRLEDDRILLQVLPQDFTLDGRTGILNPREYRGSRLEANVHVVTTSAIEHQGLVSAVHHAHLAVEETVFEAMAAGYASVLPEEREKGVAVVDIGLHSTDLAIYDGEAMVLAASLPVSADHFSRDVSAGFHVTHEDAERLKIEYGCAILGLTADNTFIEVPSGEGRAPREAPRRELNDMLEARAQFLFEYVQRKVMEAGMDRKLLEGVVLCGGGARLNGMCDVAEQVLNCPARNGLPVGILDWPNRLNHPGWTTAAGLAMYSGRLKQDRGGRKPPPPFLNLLIR
ncbi:MAG: cell division protein FtsA [Acidobacteriota bacterium]|jgi:cell division protein FtsA|nr:cell division protein FtsA [Bryobacteraceae bacterium CoA2 C42]MCA2963625.1 cell division protein FtsA [Acidobacteriaceae bacterium]